MARLRSEQNGEVEGELALPEIPAGRPAPPLGEYMAQAALAVERLLAAGLVDASRDGAQDPQGRIERAEAYARWRHGEFLAGRVHSL